MIDLSKLIKYYLDKGISYQYALARVSQDIILSKISLSKYSKNVTIKGGLVMFNITNDKRRSTIDIDISFIKYSLFDTSIKMFFEQFLLNDYDGIILKIISIKELKHESYRGKRVIIDIMDNFNNIIKTKIDIGIENKDIPQDNAIFNFECIEKSLNLKINSREQIFTEKLISIIRHNISTTRYKDFYDIYFLIRERKMNSNKILQLFETYDINKYLQTTNFNSISQLIKETLESKNVILGIESKNWLDISTSELLNTITTYLDEITYNIVS